MRKSVKAAKRAADIAFSKYIRIRDAIGTTNHPGIFRCISCGEVKPIDVMDCGHYISRNAGEIRYDERNANGECVRCNRFDSNHWVGYRKNLINKIGKRDVEELELLRHVPKSWTIEELDEIEKRFNRMAVELLRRYE